MDALALLCNLHADGPVTLQALRRAGCDSLASLESVPLPELSDLLGSDATRARRFATEARVLRDRLGSELLEEELPEFQPPAPSASLLNPPVEESSTWAGPEEGGTDEPERRPVIEAVLSAWEAHDVREEAAAHDGPDPDPEIGAAQPSAGLSLGSAELDGLDAEQARKLEEAGIETVEELVEASALDISRSSELGYTWLLRLQFLARRRLGDTLRPPAPRVRVSLGAPESSEDSRALDAAGPFA